MKLICKKESRNDQGKKIMEFTKGKSYDFYEVEHGCFQTKDDNGKWEAFFNTTIMFKPKK